MAHIHELYDFTSSAYIVFENQILLVHHKKLKVWTAPGGHVELDENPMQTLWREITEETGLQKNNLELIETGPTVKDLKSTKSFLPISTPFAMFVVDYGSVMNHKHIDLCYLLTSNSTNIALESSSSHDIGWFREEQIDVIYAQKMMHSNSHKYCKFALDFIKNINSI